MARLQSDDLSFDFQYAGFEYGWIQYQFYFLWKGESIVRNESLKKWGEYGDHQPPGMLSANEAATSGFLPFLRRVLETDEASYWEPVEPDILVALYPDDYFPFLKSHSVSLYESDESKQKRKAQEKSEKTLRKLPDDIYTLIAFVDAYNFRDADVYYGQGISLHMIVRRHELEVFTKELQAEYIKFKKKFHIDEWIAKNT